ncbi:MAG: hypothetical protein RLZZ262_2522, partial [Bacteroidota bacterium]
MILNKKRAANGRAFFLMIVFVIHTSWLRLRDVL